MKKVLLLGIILALALTLIMPSVAMAAQPTAFSASGKFTSIDEGNVSIIGFDEGYQVPIFQVQDRHIQGEFARSVKGESNRVNGPFTITYDAVVNGYQIGTFSGVLAAKSATFTVQGKSLREANEANFLGENNTTSTDNSTVTSENLEGVTTPVEESSVITFTDEEASKIIIPETNPLRGKIGDKEWNSMTDLQKKYAIKCN